MYMLPIFFTLISFFFSFFFGRLYNNYYVGLLTSILVFSSFITSLFIFYEVVLCSSPVLINISSWITIDIMELKWCFYYDSLTSVMLIVILGISTCAHFYSIEYMLSDPNHIKFMSYLSLFTFFMLLLVTSSNFIILFIGWEGVGICSYLLINFWHTRISANKSAIMAMFVNKVGDVSLLVAFAIIFLLFHTYDFFILFLSLATITNKYTVIDNYFILLNTVGILFIIGAVGKSAQLGLHTWLPEAMEGPTPVSSLIHAATMVTAGIFLIIRTNLLYQFVYDLFIIIVAIGSLTSFVGSTIGVFQADIKKIIAYSTCSQLGYMFFSCGLMGYNFSIYHLTNHAFFKALLFLIAGYIIHAVNNEQDIRGLGGLLVILPFAYIGILIGSFALFGFPFLSGFFSKEKIIELFYSYNIQNNRLLINSLLFFQFLANTAVIFTVLYSIKIVVYTFYYTFQRSKLWLFNLHYSSLFTILPLFFLSILSITSGYILEDLMVGISTDMWNNSIYINKLLDLFDLRKGTFIRTNSHVVSLMGNNAEMVDFLFDMRVAYDRFYQKITPNISYFEFNLLSSKLPIYSIFYFTFLFFYFFYLNKKILYHLRIYSIWISYVYFYLNKKYLFINKNIYYYVIDTVFLFSYNSMYTFFDKGLIEWLGPFGISNYVNKFVGNNIRLQTGLVYHYFGLMVLSIIFIILFVFLNVFK